MEGAKEIRGFAEDRGCAAFPLGTGRGGGVVVFAAEPDSLCKLREDLQDTYRKISFKIKADCVPTVVEGW